MIMTKKIQRVKILLAEPTICKLIKFLIRLTKKMKMMLVKRLKLIQLLGQTKKDNKNKMILMNNYNHQKIKMNLNL